MKKLLLAAAMVVSLAFGGAAYAASVTDNLTVSATVGAACTVSTTPVDFGAYNETTGAPGNGSITATCTSLLPYNITLDAGGHYVVNRAVSNGTDTIDYLLYSDAGKTNEWGDLGFGGTYPFGAPVSAVGTGAADVYVVHGDILAGPAVSAGNYSDTVLVTITY